MGASVKFMCFDLALRAVGSCWRWCVVGLWLAAFAATAGDWPQYRGANHDGTSGDRVLKQWPEEGLVPVWRVACTNGLSSLAVSGGRVFTQIRRNDGSQEREVCVALDAGSGTELWAVDVGLAYYPDGGVGYDDGPRSTPGVAEGKVFVLSSYLKLSCLNATNGATLWSKDLTSLYGGSVIGFQNAASPLIDNGLIFINCNTPAQSLFALRTSDGELAWRVQTESMTHSTPVIATIQGLPQVVFATQSGLLGLTRTNGALLWKARYPFTYSTSIGVSPVVHSNIVFISANYSMASFATRISLSNSTLVPVPLWTNSALKAHWMTPICYQGFLYGQFGAVSFDSPNAQLKCIDLQTGTQMWSTNGFGRGGTILVDRKIVTLTERGDLVLVQPTANAYTELARFTLFPGFDFDTNKCWNVPAVADGRIYARSTAEAICLDTSVPPLKMFPPQFTAGNQLQLWIGTSTGELIDSNRLAGMEVRATSDLGTGLGSWSVVGSPLVLTNGMVRVDNVKSGAFRYYIATEEP
jgi:outer membrane protein assembly factor BamB